jgi:amylosucrase
MFSSRPAELRERDQESETASRAWFTSHETIGGVCYVDRFAGDLRGLEQRLPYLRELGITYLHLMPLFAAPEPHNDGGYAVSSFRDVNPKLGSLADLQRLARTMHKDGIRLVLDFVFNHTSDEHMWAQRALTGESRFQAYYRMFDDRSIPDSYERFLREIFPDQAPGNFTFRPEINKWVWTTFNRFQWDLNYANPEVFRAMLVEMLFLANVGADVLRLDAVPFVWKQPGTNCENLPAVHWIIRGFNAFVRIAAPSLIFKSEAIVHPRDVQSYIAPEECQLSYNPILMSHLWDALATRETFMMRHAMSQRFALPDGCAWLNYVRSHDDIGWGFADEDAAAVGINGGDHRYFLNVFYTGRFPGSFAAGLPFNFNPRTGDMRISGTTASLAGLEKALASGDLDAQNSAIARILLLYGVVYAIGGIPLLYLGDELAALNDMDYQRDSFRAADNRWAHRPAFSSEHYATRHDLTTVHGRVYAGIQRLIAVRRATPALAGSRTQFHDARSKHIFAFSRNNQLLVLSNFSEFAQPIARDVLLPLLPDSGEQTWHELLTDKSWSLDEDGTTIPPFGIVWLVAVQTVSGAPAHTDADAARAV